MTKSATVWEMSATAGGNVRNSWGNVRISGETEYGNFGVEIVIHDPAYIIFEDTWNNMLNAN